MGGKKIKRSSAGFKSQNCFREYGEVYDSVVGRETAADKNQETKKKKKERNRKSVFASLYFAVVCLFLRVAVLISVAFQFDLKELNFEIPKRK